MSLLSQEKHYLKSIRATNKYGEKREGSFPFLLTKRMEAYRLSYKNATYISLILFAALGVLFFITSLSFAPAPKGQPIGPAYFPKLISGWLVLFCIISFITTRKKKNDQQISLQNIGYIAFTIGGTVAFVLLWKYIGGFYILSFLLLTILIYVYNQARHSIKKLLVSSLISSLFVVLVYVIFEKLFYITF